MFGEISLLTWMGSAIVFAVGGGAGFFIARQIKDKRTLELEKQLESTQSKLTQYQEDVNNHFLKTSLLFNKLTDNYREVYEHLATGAQKLCNDKPLTKALDIPEEKILSVAAASTNNDAASVDAKTTETPKIESKATKDTHHEDSEHLGVESATITEEISTAQVKANSAENTSEEPASEAQPVAETPATEHTEIKATPAAETESDTPKITKEELKTLEANEKKKAEEEDVHLGAESTPGVEPEFHKTHPSIH